MAFGKAPDQKLIRVTPHVKDQLWKASVRSENIASEAWKTKWGWILSEYEKLQKNMTEATNNSRLIPHKGKAKVEIRTSKPLPNSTAHEFGWLASRKEFRLEKFGPDIPKSLPPHKMKEF